MRYSVMYLVLDQKGGGMGNPSGGTLEDTFKRRLKLARWYFYARGTGNRRQRTAVKMIARQRNPSTFSSTKGSLSVRL